MFSLIGLVLGCGTPTPSPEPVAEDPRPTQEAPPALVVYVVVDQLVPEALEGRRGPHAGRQSTLGFMGGFLLMMVMDVSLG